MAAEDKKKGFDLQEWIDTINGLDPENIGGWPMPIKIACVIIVLALVIGGGYWYTIGDQYNQLSRLQAKESSLMQTYEDKAFKAKYLDQYREQLASMKKQFGALLKQLPKDTEVPGLLEDITHTGEGSGLEINKIGLGHENEKEFYAELPINIKVTGTYHGFGNFVSGVAALPRIVTLHDFTITPKGSLLQMDIQAMTYRYAGNKK